MFPQLQIVPKKPIYKQHIKTINKKERRESYEYDSKSGSINYRHHHLGSLLSIEYLSCEEKESFDCIMGNLEHLLLMDRIDHKSGNEAERAAIT